MRRFGNGRANYFRSIPVRAPEVPSELKAMLLGDFEAENVMDSYAVPRQVA